MVSQLAPMRKTAYSASMPAFAVPLILQQPAAYSVSNRVSPICARGDVPREGVRRNAASVLAVAAAAAFALPVVPPVRERMEPSHRNITQTAGVVALAGSILLRKTHSRIERVRRIKPASDEFVNESPKFLDPESDDNKNYDTQPDVKASISNAFSGSRAEWDQGTPLNAEFSSSKDSNPTSHEGSTYPAPNKSSNSSTPLQSSTVYSYSFRSTSSKGRKGGKLYDDKANTETAFSKMRKEFGSSPQEQGQNNAGDEHEIASNISEASKRSEQQPNVTDIYDLPLVTNSKKRQGRARRKQQQSPGPPSGVQIARRIMSLPLFLLREIILPVMEVGSVLWFDTRAQLVDWVEGQSGYLMKSDELDDWDIREDEDWAKATETNSISGVDLDEETLSEEERQVLQVERMTTGTVDTVQTALNQVSRLFFKW